MYSALPQVFNYMIKRLIILTLTIAVLVGSYYYEKNNFFGKDRIFAAGNLLITWDKPVGSPMFTVVNFLPGDTASNSANVTNSSNSTYQVALRAIERTKPGNFPTKLFVTISNNGVDFYGGSSITGTKTLANLFSDTATPSSLLIGNFSSGSSANISIKVNFDKSSGNEFQNAFVMFDLIFGVIDNGTNAVISGNGDGSTNKVIINNTNTTIINQNNNSNIFTVIKSIIQTGNVKVKGNTSISPTPTPTIKPTPTTKFIKKKNN
jgi:hypothetical protein